MPPKQIYHYEVDKRLGSGAGGIAFLATDTKLMRPVVLKMLHPRSSSDQKKRSRLLEEALYGAGAIPGNPLWKKLYDHRDFRKTLADLRKVHRRHPERWKPAGLDPSM